MGSSRSAVAAKWQKISVGINPAAGVLTGLRVMMAWSIGAADR